MAALPPGTIELLQEPVTFATAYIKTKEQIMINKTVCLWTHTGGGRK
jgi:hypothetical protein